MDSAEIAILLLNVTLALGFGIPLARMFCRAHVISSDAHKALGLLLAAYIIEGIAFMGSMATGVMSVALAAVWGILLGLRFRAKDVPPEMMFRLLWWYALYTSLPAASFGCVPVVCAVSGWSVTSVSAGHDFGIPGFVPWPMNTILGFCVGVAIGTSIIKVGLTVAIARRLALRRGGRSTITA